MISDLVMDIGAFRGEDAHFYLRKGFRVVSVEANPDFAMAAINLNRTEYESGRYRVIQAAVTDRQGEVDFFVHEHGDWSSTLLSPRFGGDNHYAIRVPSIRPEELFRVFGIPYYIKIDIEGMDHKVIDAICALQSRPRYVSFELGPSTLDASRILDRAGYGSFKLVEQSSLSQLSLPKPALEGETIDYRFSGYHSGPFGEEAPGRWVSRSTLQEQITALEWRDLTRWFDIHAAQTDQADSIS